MAVFSCVDSQSQFFDNPSYPKNYFRNPLAIPMNLSGNFGELRPNHYHMGLDCKTNARENLPVYAAADGYIARIKIEPAGFGRAIYINHPNGITTLYAHLNDFNPYLEAWVKGQQYKLASWQVFLELTPDQFPIKKGDFLAYSGNTGGSQAPHLHFEVRKTATDENLNPLFFGFPLQDNTPPKILRMAIYDRNQSTYEQVPKQFAAKANKSGGYVITPAIIQTSSPKVSLAITAYDTHDGSSNLNGIAEGQLWMDEQPIIAFRMDGISYDQTRYLNAHIDYKTKKSGGPFLQHLSELPGYTSSIYKKVNGDGVIDLSDMKVHDIRIVVKDAYGNKNQLNTKLQWQGGVQPVVSAISGKLFQPMMLDVSESGSCEFYLGERCLYDKVHLAAKELPATSLGVSNVFQIGNPNVPLQEAFLIRLQPSRQLSEIERTHTVMQWYSGTKKEVQKVEWQQGWAAARFRDFGYFQLIVDTEPPVIVPSGFNDGANLQKASRISFSVKDNLDKTKKVRAELDGNWLRFTNDKGHNYIYRFDEKCPPGDHELKIRAEDEAGNIVEKVFRIKR